MDNVFGSESGQKVLKRKRQDMQSCLSRSKVKTFAPEQNLCYEKIQGFY